MLFTDDNLGIRPRRDGTVAKPLGKANLVPHWRSR